ncbi:MAG: hypothetical protein KA138_02075 [Saprospiraceae bacterium]|nr:hypothetical protein [Saprospiraceae bacterium]
MPKPVHALKILASVELGNPAADCAHFGICSVSVLSPKQWAVFKPRHFRHAKALISVTANASLRFEFPLESMRADTRAEFFPMEGFRVDSARVFPGVVSTLLKLPEGTQIVPGLYAFSRFFNRLVVELSLENKTWQR